MEKMEPSFSKGGKFEKLHPVYDGFATFAFTPGHTTKTGAHIRDAVDLKRTMFIVVMALVPCLLFGMYNTGHQYFLAQGLHVDFLDAFGPKLWEGAKLVLPLVIVSYGVGLGVEFIFCIVKGHSIQEGFLVSGMLIPLIVPADIPLWMVAIATVFAVIFAKEVFGGTGMNILNVALTARAFLFFAYPTFMSGNNVWIHMDRDDKGAVVAQAHYDPEFKGETYEYTGPVYNVEDKVVGQVENGVLKEGIDGYTGETPLGYAAGYVKDQKAIRLAKEGLVNAEELQDEAGIAQAKADMESAEKRIETAKANEIPMNRALMGDYAGSVGETSVYAIALGALILILTGVGSWQIMISMILGGLTMGFIFNGIGVNEFMNMDPFKQVLIGSFLFGTVFMATDPVTAAQTLKGKFYYGFLAGLLAILFRVFNPAYPEGVMMAILFMNVMAPLIDHYVIKGNIKKRMKRQPVTA